jgi:hypothetical protein
MYISDDIDETLTAVRELLSLCVLGADFCGERCAKEFKAWFAAAREAEAKEVRA